MPANQESLRRVPQLEKLLQALGEIPGLPRVLVAQFARREVAALREEALAGKELPEFAGCVEKVRENLAIFARTRLQPVINGTGVLIHTNLGRSPLAEPVVAALNAIGRDYSNLELDLETGERGKRGRFLETALATLCGAEAATVVNNCASALVLILRHLASGDKNEVIISRSQLVEIGGGFRVPEIMETSGAKLREVGATNKTSLSDFKKAIGPHTAMLLQVHRSNFYMEGFVAEPAPEEIVALAHKHHLPAVEDLGSGAMADTAALASLEHEPTPAESIAKGFDLVCCSGDKLFGGPQAGIIVGKASLINAIKRDPFFRALRCDKLILAVMQETVLHYLHHAGEGRSLNDTPVPLLQMLKLNETDLRPRAEKIVAAVAGKKLAASVGEGISRCGGGTMPKSSLPSITVDLKPTSKSLLDFAAALRRGATPVVGYISEDTLKLDLRTVFPRQDETLVAMIRASL